METTRTCPSFVHLSLASLLLFLAVFALLSAGCRGPDPEEDRGDSIRPMPGPPQVQPVPPDKPVRPLPPEPESIARDLGDAEGTGPVRLAYGFVPAEGWQAGDSLVLHVRRLEVDLIETNLGCDDLATLGRIENAPRTKEEPLTPGRPPGGDAALTPLVVPTPPEPDPLVYFSDLGNHPLTLAPNQENRVLFLPELDRLPTGFILGVRLFLDQAELVRGEARTPMVVPEVYRDKGLRLGAREGQVSRCAGDVTSIRFDLDGADWISGSTESPVLLSKPADDSDDRPHALGITTAPLALFPAGGGRLEVPTPNQTRLGLWADLPEQAVSRPMVIRVREADLGDRPTPVEKGEPFDPLYTLAGDAGPFRSVDPVFRKLMGRVGQAYDLRPDGFHFARAIQIGLPAPLPRIPDSALEGFVDTQAPIPPRLPECLDRLNGKWIADMGRFREEVGLCLQWALPQGYPLTDELSKLLSGEIQGYDWPGDTLALYTWSPAYRLWLPDVPRLSRAHRASITAEVARIDGLRVDAPDLEVEPDLSAIPEHAYAGLRLNYINRELRDGYLVTDSNHFCTKSLFADLNHTGTVHGDPVDRYEPLLDGALDAMCQTGDGFGFERDSNEQVHCGGDPSSGHDIRSAERDVRDMIQSDGIDLRYRNKVDKYFEEQTACPVAGGTYCYGLEDFKADVDWAIRVWREAINRNPDGGWTERLWIDCVEPSDEECNSKEPRIDVRVRDLDSAAGRNVGRNIIVDRQTMDRVRDSQGGRLYLRAIVLHELGHALGLDHWAGPGTLMSYNGRLRRNDHRYNLCRPLTDSEVTGLASSDLHADADCLEPEMRSRWGTTGGAAPFARRMSRLTCTDVQRIRRRTRQAEAENPAAPIRC